MHTGQALQQARPGLEAADVHLFFFASHSPELSDIEPVWQNMKHRRLLQRSYQILSPAG